MYRCGSVYYAKDKGTGRGVTLGTEDRADAQRFLSAKNQAIEQSHFNVAMACFYLSCKTPEMLVRTWIEIMPPGTPGWRISTTYRYFRNQ
jgi:hypothetical protein